MLAKVMHNNSVYYSPVFAISLKTNNCKAVIFDNCFSELIVVTIFKGTSYNLLFMDYEADNFSINEDKLKHHYFFYYPLYHQMIHQLHLLQHQ